MRALIFLLVLGTAPLMAAFPRPVQAVKLRYGQTEATVAFEADCAIRKAKALCDCTTLSFSGSTLTAHVDTSGFSSSVEKQLEATTTDGKTTTLTMRFDVPQALQLSAKSLIWQQGGAPDVRELRIRIPAGSPVHSVTEAALSGDAFDYTPRTLKAGADYSVSIRPRRTDKKILNRLLIKTDSTDKRYAAYIVYLSIQP